MEAKRKGETGLLSGEQSDSAGGQSHEKDMLVLRMGKGFLRTVSSWGPSGDNTVQEVCALAGPLSSEG